uniref:AIG1-type G domain-containing protein n=1 Tax=Panagrolaimus sp. JU765 TaxID=591449 RepID=A0AC34R080_9BILA
MLFNPDICNRIKYFLIPPVNDFVLARYETVVGVRELISGDYYNPENQSNSFYVSKIKTGVIVLLRVLPKFPVDLKHVIAFLNGGSCQQHDTLKGAMDYISQISSQPCIIRCHLKPNGENVTVPDCYRFPWHVYLQQLYGAEFCCVAVEDFLQKVDVTVPFYLGSFLNGLLPKVSENLKQHLKFYQASNFSQLCQNILSMYPDLRAFRHYSYGEVYQLVTKFYNEATVPSLSNYHDYSTSLSFLSFDFEKFRKFEFSRVDGKLFVIVDTEEQKYLRLWDSPIIIVNGFKNVSTILDIYDNLESQNYLFAIFTDPHVFHNRFDGTEQIAFSQCPHFLGLMKMKPTELASKMKESNERFEKHCPNRESFKTRRWICNNCFRFVGKVGTNLLCECGESFPENCQVKCFHENHGDEWIPLVESKKIDLKSEQKKVVHELRTSKMVEEMNSEKPTEPTMNEKKAEESNSTLEEIKINGWSKNGPKYKTDKKETNQEQCNKTSVTVVDIKSKIPKPEPKLEVLPICPVPDECRNIFTADAIYKKTDNCYNILVVGQSGVGKSSLLNAFKNYLLYPTADDALKSRLNYMVPCEFPVYYEDGTKKVVKIGKDDVNEHYQSDGNNTGSTTQSCKVHPLVFGKQRINFIDTPGLTDTRGMDQDNKNLKMIYKTITSFDKIHAVCFVLKPNEIKLGVGAERALSDLLSLFPKTVMSRVIFLMTYAKGTFFRPGSTVSALAKFSANLKETRGVELPKITKETVFCFDNEAFRYLCAREKNIKYPNATLDDYKFSWDNSRDATLRFFDRLKSLEPLMRQELATLRFTRQLLLEQHDFIKENYLKENVTNRPYLLVGYYLVAQSLDNMELALYGKDHLNCIHMKKLEEFLKQFKLATSEEKSKFLAIALKKFQTTLGSNPKIDLLILYYEKNKKLPDSVFNF